MSETAESEFETMREEMLEVIAAYALLSSDRTQKEQFDTRVMEAIARVPRHDYVPNELQDVAYANIPLPIGHGKTISQPFIVALMTDLLDLQEDDRVLEIGTGLGYQAAILAELVQQVYTVEIIEELGRWRPGLARKRVLRQGDRDRRAGARPAGPDRAAQARRPIGHPGRARGPAAADADGEGYHRAHVFHRDHPGGLLPPHHRALSRAARLALVALPAQL
jgi:protein-L-isoaspartate(D-aspartate) O-methyltransferase